MFTEPAATPPLRRVVRVRPLRAGLRCAAARRGLARPTFFQRGFTLTEVIFTSGLSLIVLTALMTLWMFSSRSFVAAGNYVALDQQSQLALDKMTKEIRQVQKVTSAVPANSTSGITNLTFLDYDANLLSYAWDRNSRTLTRVKNGQTTTNLLGCDTLAFSLYSRTPDVNDFQALPATYATNAKMVEVTWTCSRTLLGAKANSESMVSARVVIRKK